MKNKSKKLALLKEVIQELTVDKTKNINGGKIINKTETVIPPTAL